MTAARLVYFMLIVVISNGLAGDTAGAEEWELERDEGSIKVYTRKLKDSPYREFKGVIELKTSLASALGLLDDTAACKDWLHLCEENFVLDFTSRSERFIYQVSDLPFPASTRDAIFKAVTSQDPDGSIRIELTSRPDFIPDTDYMRIRNAHGSYVLQEIDEDTVRLTWTMYVDPGGSLPAFLVNRLLTAIPFKSLRNFREVVQQNRYQVLRFEYDEHGNPVDLRNRTW